MAKTKKAKATPKEEVIKEVSPSIEAIEDSKGDKGFVMTVDKDEFDTKDAVETPVEEVKLPLNPPLVEVKEEELSISLEPDTIDDFAVFAKAKKEDKGQVWVKDHTLLKKVEGRQFTLGGTEYLGELK